MHYYPTLPLRVAAKVSSYGLGAVLSHIMSDGLEHPVTFASRTLTDSEKNILKIEKEDLAPIFGIRKFHQYIYGRKFSLVTNHKPLLAIMGPKKGIPSLVVSIMQRGFLSLSLQV